MFWALWKNEWKTIIKMKKNSGFLEVYLVEDNAVAED